MFKTLFAIAGLVAFVPTHAATVAQWDFEAAVAPAAATTTWTIGASAGTGTATATHATAATFSTPVGNGSSKSASVNTWAVGDYWQFSFSTLGFTGLSLSFDQAGSSTGPRDFTLAYSVNGGAYTNFASYTVATSTFSSSSYNAAFTYTYDLSALSALNNASSVAVRLVDASTTSIGGATVAAGGTDRVDNFTVLATPVPEPGTVAMLFAGLGVVGFVARRRKA